MNPFPYRDVRFSLPESSRSSPPTPSPSSAEVAASALTSTSASALRSSSPAGAWLNEEEGKEEEEGVEEPKLQKEDYESEWLRLTVLSWRARKQK